MTITSAILHRRTKIAGAMLLAVVLLLLVLPMGTKVILTRWLEKNGADSATIESLRFNPFLGRITMEGVDVVSGGKPLLRNATMVVDFGFASLRHRDIHLETAEYRDLSIDIEQFADGRWRFGTYTTAVSTGTPAVKTEAPQKDDVAWAFVADRVVLAACRVHLKTPELDSQIVIDHAELVRFTTREGQPAASMTLQGLFNDSRVDINVSKLQLVPELRIDGALEFTGVKLAGAAGFVKDVLPSFAGEVGMSGKLVVTDTPEKGMAVEYNGTIAVSAGEIGSKTFITKAKNLRWQGRARYSAEPKMAMIVETDGTLSAGDFALQLPEAAFVTEEALIEQRGKTTVTIGKNVTVENSGTLRIEGIGLQLPQFAISEEKVVWQGKVRYDSVGTGKGPDVLTAGSLDFGKFQLEDRAQPPKFAASGATFAWRGDASYGYGDGVPSIHLKGSLAGTELQEELVELNQSFAQGMVELQATSTVSLGGKTIVTGQASLAGEKLAFASGGDPLLNVDNLAITGLEERPDAVIAAQDLVATGLKAHIGGSLPVIAELGEIHVTDARLKDNARFAMGQLQLKDSAVKAVRTEQQLVGWKQLSFMDLQGEGGEQVKTEAVLLEGLTALTSSAKEKPTLVLGKATLSGVDWSTASGLKAGILRCDDLTAVINRDKEGGLTFLAQLAAMQEPTLETAAVSKDSVAKIDQSAAMPFRLDKVMVGGKSSILLTDHTLAVPLVTDLAITKLQLGKVDSQKPSDKTPVQLVGTFLDRAPIEVQGDISPFLPQPALDLTLSLKNYPLSGLSPYTVQSVGTALASGQLRLTSQATLTGGVLEMANKVQLQKLITETITPELAAQLNNQLPIPLDAALSLLRDSEENIVLDIPLHGPVSDLSVGVSDILITALGKAIIPAASGYLMYALGPYGALAYVGLKVGEHLLQVRLPPIIYTPGDVALTEEHGKYLERIALILKDRPQTDMQFCPVVASWELMSEKERAAVAGDEVEVQNDSRQSLLALGQQRAKEVRRHLVEKYGIRQDRLFICDTQIAREKKAEPAVIPQL